MKTRKSRNLHTGCLDVQLDGTQLAVSYFIRSGPGIPILYLHGLGCSKDDFLGAVDSTHLAGFTLVAFDFPGSGSSPYPDPLVLTMDDLAQCTRQVRTALSLPDPVVAGHSMGGLVALLYIERFHAASAKGIAGFVNIEGNLSSSDCFFSRRVAEHTYDDFRATVFPYFVERLARSRNEGYAMYARTLRACGSTRAYWDYSRSLVEACDRGTLFPFYAAMKQPTLFVYGEENKHLPCLPLLTARGCRLAEIRRSSHFPGYENPEELYAVIGRFARTCGE